MRYSRRNKFSPGARLTALIIGAALLLFVLIRFVAPGALPTLFSPLFSLGNEAREDTALVAELRNENEALKARLRDVGAADSIPSEVGILVGVIARPPVSPYDSYLLSRGTEAGIHEGAIAFAKGVPIGSVVESSEGFSRVLLYSSSLRQTAGWIGEEREPVTLSGEGAGAFSTVLPRESAVLEGDTVYLPGPGAVPGGYVRTIERNASSPHATLRIEPLVNPFTVTYLRVLP